MCTFYSRIGKIAPIRSGFLNSSLTRLVAKYTKYIYYKINYSWLTVNLKCTCWIQADKCENMNLV